MSNRLLGAAMATFVVFLAAGRALAAEDRQATYNGAQAAFDKGGWSAAADGFARLLPPYEAPALTRSQAVIAARYASAKQHLGQLDEAERWIDRALPALPADDPEQLAVAWITKAEVARFRYDFPEAVKAYEEADKRLAPLGMSAEFMRARMGFAFAASTYDPAAARTRMEGLLSDTAFAKSAPRMTLAVAEELAARAAINAGDKVSATRWIERAVDDSGGLTDRNVTTTQAAIRADAGIIARMRGDDEHARKYLTYTGAGHVEDLGWITDHAGELPVCDGESILPDDNVVVTFAIGEDGQVLGAVPTITSRPGSLGSTFARAVSEWRWNPERLKKVSGYWRSTLQLELRCVQRPEPAQLGAAAWKEAGEWLASHDLLSASELKSVRTQQYIRIRNDDLRLKAPAGAALKAVAGAAPEKQPELLELWSQLDSAGAPPSIYAILINRSAGYGHQSERKAAYRAHAKAIGEWLPRLQAKFGRDPSVSWLTVEQAIALEDSGDFAGAQPLLQGLIDDTTSPIVMRQVATLHRAIGLERTGDTKTAEATLAKAGLNAEQCSLFDTRPIASSVAVADSAYPEEAQRWQFEGFAQEAYDIAADGHVEGVRTVVAYPPYIFDRSSERAVKLFRFIPPKIGGRAVGCQSQLQSIKYRMAP